MASDQNNNLSYRERTSVLKVLLIEDKQKDRDLIANYLMPALGEASLYMVEFSTNLTRGLERIKKRGIDVILLDIALPESHGLEAFRFVSEEAPDIPIVVLTGIENTMLAHQTLKLGAQDYLVKDSINTQLLKRAIDYACERKQLQMELSAAEEKKFKHIIDKNLDAMVVLNEGKKILFVNDAAERLFDETQTALLNQNFEYPVEINKNIQIEILQKTGKKVVGEIRASHIEWEKKNDILVTIRDVTEFQKVESLKSQINEYERISKLKDQFLGTVSHELRTPLTIIRGAVGNMIDGIVGDLTEQQVRVMQIANNNVSRLARIIDDLLDLSRLESEKVRINPRQIDMDSFIERIIQSFQIVAQEKGLVLIEERPKKTPSLFADPDMLSQVMNNLIINAMRYAHSKIIIRVQKAKSLHKTEEDDSDALTLSGKTEKNRHATVSVSGNAEYVQISVIDDGPGMPKDQMGDLFNKFVQINRPIGGAGYKGTGLGLAICKAIIDQHQGKIWAKSKQGEGSQFHVMLSHYDEAKIFYANLNHALNEAAISRAALCVILGFVSNIEELYEKSDHESVQAMFEEAQTEIQSKLLRKEEKVSYYSNRGVIMVMVHAIRDGGESLKTKIVGVMSQMKCYGRDREIVAHTSVGMALYPEESDRAASLLNIAYQNAQSRKVLIIDDEQSILDMIAVLLRVREYTVETAVDGEGGLDLAVSFAPDVIVLDIMMPGLNGWDVCRRLRADPRTKNVAIIVLTASMEAGIEDQARSFNAVLMGKPYDPKKLLDCLKKESQARQGEFRF
ncbi:MAG: response regulator [Deltaproteobacteria bacterium]|nr:response regulator [Deltaproteobacteria bacterium]